EVAPAGVFRLRAEDVVAQHAAVLVFLRRVGIRGAEGRYFHRFAAHHHVHQPETPPDDQGAAKQRLHLLGSGIGRDVEVLRHDAEQQVAYRAAHDVGLKTRLAQHRAYLGGSGAERLARETVFAACDPFHLLVGKPEYPPDEPLDHSRAGILPALPYRRRERTGHWRRAASVARASSGSTATARVTR